MTLQVPVCIPVYRQWATLINGEQILIRPADPGDREALKAFFGRLGEETRFLRFHYTKAAISDEEISTYCNCDYADTFAIVAEKSRGGSNDIVGVARYDRLPAGDCAEVAFLVEDKEQGNGIGTHLVRELAEVARERGMETFVAETTTYNQIMLSIFRKYDSSLKREVDGESCKVTYKVQSKRF
jgi:N-acetylglutamate synthase-like GNAT family acetyltransferase